MATETATPPKIRPLPEFAGILREQENFATGEREGVSEQINTAFDRLMLQSGLGIAPSMLLLLCLCSGIAIAGLVFVIQENFLTTSLAAGFGFVLPMAAAVIARTRRQTEIMRQMPGMVDELARAAKTGRSLDQCVELVASDTVSPLGDEMRLCVQKMDLGIDLGTALKELPERTGLVSLNVFVMALTVHQQTGGDLPAVLDRLSRTIRDRISFLGRLRAATAASRASALLMIGLPPAIVTFFVFRDPEYFGRLMSATWGRNITIIAVILQIIGAAWVLRIMKDSQRT